MQKTAADFSLLNLIAKKSVAKSRQKTSAPNDALVLCLTTKRMDYFRSAQRLKARIFFIEPGKHGTRSCRRLRRE